MVDRDKQRERGEWIDEKRSNESLVRLGFLNYEQGNKHWNGHHWANIDRSSLLILKGFSVPVVVWSILFYFEDVFSRARNSAYPHFFYVVSCRFRLIPFSLDC